MLQVVKLRSSKQYHVQAEQRNANKFKGIVSIKIIKKVDKLLSMTVIFVSHPLLSVYE